MSSPVQALWASCPTVTRLVVLGYPAVSVARMLLVSVFPSIALLMPPCTVYWVVQQKLVWAMPMSFIFRPIDFGPGVLFVFFEVYMALAILPRREYALGSAAFGAWLVVITMLMNSLYLAWMFILSFAFGPTFLLRPIQGLWSLLMFYMAQKSFKSPDESVNFWGVISMPNKWYPLFLTALLSLLNGTIMWDLVAALVVSYAHYRFQLEKSLKSWLIERFAKCFSPLQRFSGKIGGSWVPAGGLSMPDDQLEQGFGTVINQRRSAENAPTGNQASSFRVFSGTGQRLGS